MSRDDQTLRLRAQEILMNGPTSMPVAEAWAQAIWDRYGDDPKAMAQAFATLAAKHMSNIRKTSYQVSEGEGLFDIGAYIVVSTPDEGDLFVWKRDATTDQVRQWGNEGLQHFSTGRLRFKRVVKDLELIEDVDGDQLWTESRKVLGKRKQALEAERKKELEPGE